MALFQLMWLRRLIRRHTKPIPEETAHLWKRRLSLIYMLAAWNAFGIVCYMIYNGKADWAHYYGYKSDEQMKLTPAQQWTKTLGIKDATVYRISGFNVHKYQIHNEFENKDQPNETLTGIQNTNEAETLLAS